MRRARNSGRKPDLIAMMGFHQKRYSVNIPSFLLSATHAALPIIYRHGLWVISGALFLGGSGFSSPIWRTLHLAAYSDDRYRRYSGKLWGLWPWQPVQPSYPAALGPMDWNYRAAPGDDGSFFQTARSRGSHAGALHCSLAAIAGLCGRQCQDWFLALRMVELTGCHGLGPCMGFGGLVGSGICTTGVRKRVTWIRLHLICQGMLYNEVPAPTHRPCACLITP